MARSLPPRMVQCYQCDHRFEVGGSAQSTSCPGCNRPVMVADQIIKGQRGPIRELKTCGKIVVGKRGRLICQNVVAHAGLECDGIIDAKTVASNNKVVLGPKANFRGDLTAPVLDIADGTVIQPSYFRIGEPPPGYVPSPPTDTKTPGANHPAPAAPPRTPAAVADRAAPDAPPESPPPKSPSLKKKAPKKKAPKKKAPEKKPPQASDTPAPPPPAAPAPRADDAPSKPAPQKPAPKKLKPDPDPVSDPAPMPKKKAPKRRTPPPTEDEAKPKKKVPKRRKKPGTDGPSAFVGLLGRLAGFRLALRSFLF